ncbi:hypothetical protein [Actinomadura roseirufa]|uniref:hypothetical protein n=1 Tax=Actinomadura roseirufa TaxID=2094049 RepID=UPI0010411745|nr:hypothetical protein [Actinomadura roseirufa]
MGSSFPLVPGRPGSPEPRRSGEMAKHAPASAPLHRAGEMTLGESRLRQESWESIGARTRERLAELSGPAIEWFARTDVSSGDGRCYAVTFGEAGLSIAEPRVNTEHRPVYAISSFQFAPGSLRHMRVDHRPPPHASRPSATGAPGAASAPGLGLSPNALGILGNLPPRAQELLQTPFLAGQQILRNHWYYEGHDHRLNVFVFYLAGAKDVTFATGTKLVPAGHTDATAHWDLTCYRASVARRIGR